MSGESAPLEGAAVADTTCPYLGMVGDPTNHHTFPSRTHLCMAGEPAHIGLGFQADYCLGGAYPSCARFQRAEEAAAVERAAAGAGAAIAPRATGATFADPAGDPPGDPAGDPAAIGAAAAASPLTPVPAGSAKLGRVRSPGQRGSSPLVSVLLGLALLSTLVAFAIAAGFIHLPTGGPIAVASTPPAGTSTAPPSPSITPTPSASPSPSPTPSPSPSPTPDTGEVLHTVQPGETLTSISEFYDVPIDAIVTRNGLANPNDIQAGQVLIIPLNFASFTPAPPTPSNGPSSSPGKTPKPSGSPQATSFIYIVQSGDTLGKIADMFHVLQQAILDANPEITDPNTIFVGQEIVIPAAP